MARTPEFEFRFIVQQASDGQLEAYCIDSGAVGVGNTVLAAVTDMISALEEMYQASRRGRGTLYADPTKRDLALYGNIFAGARSVPTHVVGAGSVIRRQRKEHGRLVHVGFDTKNLQVLRAA